MQKSPLLKNGQKRNCPSADALCTVPLCLVPLAGRPLLDCTLDSLRLAGVTEVTAIPYR